MKKPVKLQAKARNNAAHASLQSYFDRISHSLEDRISEYVQMKKYIRIYEESQKLLEIEKAINIAAGSIYEINIDKKLDINALNQLIQLLNKRNRALRSFIQGKSPSIQIKLLFQISKHLQIIMTNLSQIEKNLTRINEVIPIIKVIVKMRDKEDNREYDPVLKTINDALTTSIHEPNLTQIRMILQEERINTNQYDAKLHFEFLNDVSDKLIGLLNDKLLLIIGISEFLIAGIEDDGANDVEAEERLPDELRVLFLASSTLDVLYRTKKIRQDIKGIFSSIKFCLKIINSDRLEKRFKSLLKSGNDNLYDLLVNETPKVLQRTKKSIIEISPGLDALDLKLKLDNLDLNTVMNMVFGLIYEKSNRIWENPYDI